MTKVKRREVDTPTGGVTGTAAAGDATFELGACESYDNGVVYLNYRPQA